MTTAEHQEARTMRTATTITIPSCTLRENETLQPPTIITTTTANHFIPVREIGEVISNFKLQPILRLVNDGNSSYWISDEQKDNSSTTSIMDSNSTSLVSSLSTTNIHNISHNNSATTTTGTTHHSIPSLPPSNSVPVSPSKIVPSNENLQLSIEQHEREIIMNSHQQDDYESLLEVSHSTSSDSKNIVDNRTKRYFKIGLMSFHIICQLVMSIMILASFIVYDWTTMIVFTPKIVVGFLILIAVYKKKNGFLHFLLGSILLDLIYTTILLCLRFWVTAKPDQKMSVMGPYNAVNEYITGTPEWKQPDNIFGFETANVFPYSFVPMEHLDKQSTSEAQETQRRKLPGLWYQFGVQLIGGFVVFITIIWTFILNYDES